MPYLGGQTVRALSSFVTRGMNLTNSEPKPLRENNREYCFFVDLTGKVDENILMKLLSKDCKNYCLLGVYQADKVDAGTDS